MQRWSAALKAFSWVVLLLMAISIVYAGYISIAVGGQAIFRRAPARSRDGPPRGRRLGPPSHRSAPGCFAKGSRCSSSTRCGTARSACRPLRAKVSPVATARWPTSGRNCATTIAPWRSPGRGRVRSATPRRRIMSSAIACRAVMPMPACAAGNAADSSASMWDAYSVVKSSKARCASASNRMTLPPRARAEVSADTSVEAHAQAR